MVGLLIAFSLLFVNSAVVGHAMCAHADAQSHAAALSSDDERESSTALAEEMATKAASKSGTTVDVSVPVVGVLDPSPLAVRQADLASSAWVALATDALPNRTTAPPSRPPLN